MASVPRRLSIVGLLLLTCGGAVFGGDYTDPSGFSFTYPEGQPFQCHLLGRSAMIFAVETCSPLR
jgi:hypothetical protein